MKVLIATSGTETSIPAIMQGGFFARVFDVKPTLLTVVASERHKEQGQKALDSADERLAELRVEAQGKIRYGNPADEIIAEAKEGEYDLLVMGEGRKLNLLERVFGDTIKKVLSNMPTSILVAKGVSDDFDRILLCDSLGREGILIETFIDCFPEMLSQGEDVTILHVMSQMGASPAAKSWELHASAEELIEADTVEGKLMDEELDALRKEQKELDARPKVRHGAVVEEIMIEAEQGGYDLLVIGAHRSEGWQRFLLENLASRIITNSRKPVLILPRAKNIPENVTE